MTGCREQGTGTSSSDQGIVQGNIIKEVPGIICTRQVYHIVSRGYEAYGVQAVVVLTPTDRECRCVPAGKTGTISAAGTTPHTAVTTRCSHLCQAISHAL